MKTRLQLRENVAAAGARQYLSDLLLISADPRPRLQRRVRKRTLLPMGLLAVTLSLLLHPSSLPGAPLGAAFTYQGRLNDSGQPANGIYDLRFAVFDAVSGPSRIGAVLTNAATAVSNGLFTVTLDFGPGVFTGEARWLEIGVRPGGSLADFATLSPRQPLTPAPQAIYAPNAGVAGAAATVTGPVAASQLTGTIASSNIAVGTITAAQLASGAASANLSASGQSAVGAGGIVLSEFAANSNLLAAGYVQLGKALDFNQEFWTNRPGLSDSGKLSARRAGHMAVWADGQMYICAGYDEDGVLYTGPRYDADDQSWDYISKDTPAPNGYPWIGVWTGSQLLCSAAGLVRYDPGSNRWFYTSSSNAPSPSTRYKHAAVWAGTELLVWGGGNSSGTTVYNDGARYNPANNTWTKMATNGAPQGRMDFAYVWTGSELIVWGGRNASSPLNSGARYNPSTDSWQALSIGTNTPTPRNGCKAVWTGTQMLIWGGWGTSIGGRYTPATDSWLAMNTNGVPSYRTNHTMIWTGQKAVVYGGTSTNSYSATGGIYDPVADSWTAMSLSNAPAGRALHSAVWDPVRQEMIVWGGQTNSVSFTDTGGRFSVSNNTWAPLSIPPRSGEPGNRGYAAAVWTGRRFLAWGGMNGASFLGTGGYHIPGYGMSSISVTGAPSPRMGHTAVWTGSEMLVWGGFGEGGDTATGGRYHDASNTWRSVTTINAPASRRYHTAVWTGTEMVIWGGMVSNQLGVTFFADGGRYDPVSDIWRPLNNNLPGAARARHTAIWNGEKMFIWGGYSASGSPGGTNFNPTGYSYRPGLADGVAWAELPSLNAPQPAVGHSAVWTTREMIVWGGMNEATLDTGARYDPALNSWTSVTTNGAPTARSDHAACWDGSKMIIWGTTSPNGARYDPALDQWLPITSTGSVSGGWGHCSAWSGQELILWPHSGGYGSSPIYSYTPPRWVYLYMRP